jgi:hypothetical protein
MALPWPKTPTTPANAFSEIAEAILPYMNATIRIKDPKTLSAPLTPYDAQTDTGGIRTATVVWEGVALITAVRRPMVGGTSLEWTATNPYSFQIPLTATSKLVRKGMQLQVLNGGNDPALTELAFVVTKSAVSSQAPVRLLEATAENTSAYPQA